MERGLRSISAVAALLVLLLAIPFASLEARELVSTAKARWSVLGTEFENSSNTVTIAVGEKPFTFRASRPASGGAPTLVSAAQCGNVPLAAAQPPAPATMALADTRTIFAGEQLVLEIASDQLNRDSGSIDKVQLSLEASGEDAEIFWLVETAADSGIFRAAVPTHAAGRDFVRNDCRLAVTGGQILQIAVTDSAGRNYPVGTVSVLSDPYGLILDSQDGRPVSGARVSLVDASGQSAAVFAADGQTRWPSELVSGRPITDGAGVVHEMQEGEYRFPLVRRGSYRLLVQPPSPFSAPSAMPLAHLTDLRRAGNQPLALSDGSFGRPFEVTEDGPVKIDVPVDRPAVAPMLTKSVSRALAQPGDALVFTLTASNPDPLNEQRNVVVLDRAQSGLRLQADSVRVDGVTAPPSALSLGPDGTGFTLQLGQVGPGAVRKVTYVMRVREDAAPGYRENVATLTDSRGVTSTASTSVRIEREIIASRMTIIGRVTHGECGKEAREGLGGVQVMLEDGSFAVTGPDGRYHFEGVMPGTHVVQIARHSLPKGAEPLVCKSSVRSGDSPISRFVMGQGGSLAVAEFVVRTAERSSQQVKLPFEPVLSWESGNKQQVKLPFEPMLGWESGNKGHAGTEKSAASPAPPAMSAIGVTKATDNIVVQAPAPAVIVARQDAESSARKAAGADVDWMALGDGPDDFLFPSIDHNPSAPAVRVVIRHRPGHKVQVTIRGKPVSDLAFDGATVAPGKRYAISIWRGIPLEEGGNMLAAQIVDAKGAAVARIERNVHYSGAPIRAELLSGQSRLVADGRTRPVIAVRLTDRKGRPARRGLTGQLSINSPYESAAALEALQLSQLSGAGAATPRWIIEGDDGVALIELAPTMVSGALRLGFVFNDGDVRREQRIDGWITPGDQEWTLVALAEGALGAASIEGLMEQIGPDGRELGKDARVAFYTKGKILGKFLLTAAYDSAKDRAEQRLLGVIDPNSYYTVFGDGSDRRFDAASRERLYVRLESSGFNALYGDFVTGFDQTDLAAYRRTATGVRAEARDGKWHAEAFAARTASNQRRDEIQGSGLTGPYRLSTRAIVPNSERIVLEVRDRFRSELIISRQELTRFVDYDLDLLSGTVRLRQPFLSRDADLNPQFIVIDYEVDEGRGTEAVQAGVRADYTALDGGLVVGATAISDSTNAVRGTLVAMDARAQLDGNTEVRGEIAASEMAGNRGLSWQAEAEHHSGKLDVLAYARSIAPEFGIGQQNLAEKGRRKLGVDARYAINTAVSITASTWIDENLADASRRHAAQINGVLRTEKNDWRLGASHFSDRLADGSRQSSSVIEGAVTRRLLKNRLELALSSSVALGSAQSGDLPARHRLGARYALNSATRLLASYEIADGAQVSARTFSGGVELTPWTGGRIVTSLGQSDISEQGQRTYAAAGLAQSIQVTPQLGLDVSIDGNRQLGGGTIIPVNPAQPLASGGHLGDGAGLFEDFTAITLGANWRKDRWSATGRGEWRDGELADRTGMTLGLIRQIGEGSVLGSGFSWTRASANGAGSAMGSEVIDASVAVAYRPSLSALALLGKLEYRSDEITGAVAGEAGPAGRSALTISGDGRSRRFIGSVSGNWSPKDPSGSTGQSELGLFVGMRHSLDAVEGYNLSGSSLIAGLDARLGLGDWIELGLSGTMRANITDGDQSYAVGPNIGISPIKGTLFTIGYNIRGFEDPDFSETRASREGLFLVVRAKIDQDSFGFLKRNQR